MNLESRLGKLERTSGTSGDGPPFLIIMRGENGYPTSGKDWIEAERAAASEVARERYLETGLRIVAVTREEARAWVERHRTKGRRR
jgi:hypothetical protein